VKSIQSIRSMLISDKSHFKTAAAKLTYKPLAG